MARKDADVLREISSSLRRVLTIYQKEPERPLNELITSFGLKIQPEDMPMAKRVEEAMDQPLRLRIYYPSYWALRRKELDGPHVVLVVPMNDTPPEIVQVRRAA